MEDIVWIKIIVAKRKMMITLIFNDFWLQFLIIKYPIKAKKVIPVDIAIML